MPCGIVLIKDMSSFAIDENEHAELVDSLGTAKATAIEARRVVDAALGTGGRLWVVRSIS